MSFPISKKSEPKHYVGVFCGADEKIPELYKNLTFELGLLLYNQGYGLVTGGANCGLMNSVMRGFAFQNDASHMYGVLPSVFKIHNVHHPKILTENLHWTDDIYQRLQAFQDKCNSIIVLPGGLGTLHELMNFMVLKQWGLIQKKIILFNVDQFWDFQLLQFEVMVKKNALQQKHLDLLSVVTNLQECLEAIKGQETLHQGLNDRFWE